MIKQLISILIVLTSYSEVLSQTSNILVTYYPEILTDTDTLKGPEHFVNLYKSSLQKAQFLSYELNYWNKENISLFHKDDKPLSLINKIDKLTLDALIALNGTYKITKDQFLIHEYTVQNLPIQVLIEKPIDWSITTESKIILGYNCYKAKGKILYGKKKGQDVEAWFSKDLAIPVGPGIYIGLPGLILEIREKNILLTVKSIEFEKNSSKINDIDIPNKNSLLTVEEADSILKIVNEKAERFLKY